MSNLENASIEELEKVLAKKREEAKKKTIPQPMENPDFAPIINLAKHMIQEVIDTDGYSDDDNEYWCFEAVLECVYGKDIWDWWNQNCAC